MTEVIPGLALHCRQHNELTRDLFQHKGMTGASNGWLDVQLADRTVALRLWLLDSMDRGCHGARGWHVPLPVRIDSEHAVRQRCAAAGSSGLTTSGCAQGLRCRRHRRVARRASAAVVSGPQQPGCHSHSGGEHWHKPLSRSVACDGHPSQDIISWRCACLQPEFMAAWNTQPISGRRQELISCPSADSGAFQALKDAGVGLIISGHDHDNNFCAKHEGVRLCYGHKTGYGSYGPPPGWQRGARILQYTFGSRGEADLQTWIRLEDGTVLNDTLAVTTPIPQTACNAGA